MNNAEATELRRIKDLTSKAFSEFDLRYMQGDSLFLDFFRKDNPLGVRVTCRREIYFNKNSEFSRKFSRYLADFYHRHGEGLFSVIKN